MTFMDFMALSPMVILVLSALTVLMVNAFARNLRTAMGITFGGFALSIVFCIISLRLVPRDITPLIVMDAFSLLMMGIFAGAGLFITLMSYDAYRQCEGQWEEFFLFLTIATLGAMTLAASRHFISFFLGLETLTVSLYAMLAYCKKDVLGHEAGIKYLILAAVSSAFLLFGMALFYAETGSMMLADLSELLAESKEITNPFILVGLALMFVGIGFKLALVPFHLWTPDVYQGALTPVTAFVATVSKGGVFALLLRYFGTIKQDSTPDFYLWLTLIAVASMLFGNLLALFQNHIKRILAYSSIAHLGYMTAALLAGGLYGVTAGVFYLLAYFVTILIAFGVISFLSTKDFRADTIQDIQGLLWRRPWMGGIFTLSLLSLAGIPLTGGFIGKFYILTANVDTSLWLLLFFIILTSAIGLFYYLRILVSMLQKEEGIASKAPKLSFSGAIVLSVLTVMLVGLGIYPYPFFMMIQYSLSGII